MMRVAIMANAEKLQDATSAALSLGFEPILAESMTVKVTDSPEFGRFMREMASLTVDRVIFTSEMGVRAVFILARQRSDEGSFRHRLNQHRVIAIGPRTSKELEAHGVLLPEVPAMHTPSGIVAMDENVRGRRFWLLRSDRGTEELPAGLKAKGATVQEAMVYSIDLAIGSESMLAMVLEVLNGVDAIAFSSALSVHTFMETARTMGPRSVTMAALDAIIVGALDRSTRTRLEQEGVRVDAVPSEADIHALLLAILAASKGRNTPGAMVPP